MTGAERVSALQGGRNLLLLAAASLFLGACAVIQSENPRGLEYWQRLREIAAAADAADNTRLSETAYDKLLRNAEYANPLMLAQAGIELRDAGHESKARAFFEKAASLPFMSKAQRIAVGRLLLQADAADLAEHIARVGMRRHLYDKSLMNLLAVSLGMLGHNDEARQYFLEILSDIESRRNYGTNYLLFLILAGKVDDAQGFALTLKAEGILPRGFEAFLENGDQQAGCLTAPASGNAMPSCPVSVGR